MREVIVTKDAPLTQAEGLAWALGQIGTPMPTPDPLDAVTVAASTEWVIPPLSALADERWREAFGTTKFAEALAWLCYERPFTTLDPITRAGLRSFAENWIEDAVKAFGKPTVKLDSLRSHQQALMQGDGYRDGYDGLTGDGRY